MRTKKTASLAENLSSNVLFHFTNSFEKLKGILKDGFKVSYVAEILLERKNYYIAPMVCFCDIPLGGIKEHLHRYGDYGVGIHKSFFKGTEVNPVFYIYTQATLEKILPTENIRASITGYLKKYNGRDYKRLKSFRFYNEREWRYVDMTNLTMFTGSVLDARQKCDDFNKNISMPTYLKFKVNLVEYIIVRSKKEIIPMLEFLNSAELPFTPEEKKMLCTKIISATRVKYDF